MFIHQNNLNCHDIFRKMFSCIYQKKCDIAYLQPDLICSFQPMFACSFVVSEPVCFAQMGAVGNLSVTWLLLPSIYVWNQDGAHCSSYRAFSFKGNRGGNFARSGLPAVELKQPATMYLWLLLHTKQSHRQGGVKCLIQGHNDSLHQSKQDSNVQPYDHETTQSTM